MLLGEHGPAQEGVGRTHTADDAGYALSLLPGL